MRQRLFDAKAEMAEPTDLETANRIADSLAMVQDHPDGPRRLMSLNPMVIASAVDADYEIDRDWDNSGTIVRLTDWFDDQDETGLRSGDLCRAHVIVHGRWRC